MHSQSILEILQLYFVGILCTGNTTITSSLDKRVQHATYLHTAANSYCWIPFYGAKVCRVILLFDSEPSQAWDRINNAHDAAG